MRFLMRQNLEINLAFTIGKFTCIFSFLNEAALKTKRKLIRFLKLGETKMRDWVRRILC